MSSLLQDSRTLAPSPWRRPETRALLLFNLMAVLITAYSSETYFHPDEHYQIIEFAGLKLGFTPVPSLPWEYAERVRPFMQPALYYALLKPLIALGLSDRFLMLFLARLASGLFAFAAMVSLMRTSLAWVSHAQAERARVRWLTLAGFLPYLAVRTSSENLAGAFFLFALSALVRDQPAEGPVHEEVRLSPIAGLAAGVWLGMSFECRFQMGFSIVGLLAWIWWIRRDRITLAWLALGAAIPLLAALVIDRWGYGAWTFPPWHYLRVNILEGKAAEFGTKWFFAYLHITLANIFAPLVILIIVGLTLCWIQRPRHVLTWATLPFVLAHSLVGHKEERFLLPILMLGLVGAAMGYEQRERVGTRWLQRAGDAVAAAFRGLQQTKLYRALVVWNFAGLVLLAVYPLGWRPHEGFANWAYSRRQPVRIAVEDPRLVPDYPFLRERPWEVHVVDPNAESAPVPSDGAPLYFVRDEPFTDFDPEARGVSSELVYTEFPLASSSFLREHLWPLLGAWRTTAVSRGYQAKRATWLSVYRAVPR